MSQLPHQSVHITGASLLDSLSEPGVLTGFLVSMADLIAKVSRTNTSWKDPSLSHTQNLSYVTSGHHDTQPKVNRFSKPSNLESHNLPSMSSEIQLDHFSVSSDVELNEIFQDRETPRERVLRLI